MSAKTAPPIVGTRRWARASTPNARREMVEITAVVEEGKTGWIVYGHCKHRGVRLRRPLVAKTYFIPKTLEEGILSNTSAVYCGDCGARLHNGQWFPVSDDPLCIHLGATLVDYAGKEVKGAPLYKATCWLQQLTPGDGELAICQGEPDDPIIVLKRSELPRDAIGDEIWERAVAGLRMRARTS